MIVTLTPNPSIDRTVSVGELLLGEVNRASGVRIDPGGKGVNVSRALHANGHPTLAVFPSGGHDGTMLGRLLDEAGVRFTPVVFDGRTRTNIAVVGDDGTTTKINEPGPQLDLSILDALFGAIPTDADWVAVCGRLPEGATPEWFARIVAGAPGHAVVDTSGMALAAAVAEHPDLIKPNREELTELTGRQLPKLGDVVEVSHRLVADGVGTVVTSLGADGALWVDAREIWFASAPLARPISSVGAGDCLLAGLLSALSRGAGAREALECGVGWGTAAVAQPGSAIPTPTDITAVQVTSTDRPDLSMPLGN